MAFRTLDYRREGRVVTLTLNRPQVLNAIDTTMGAELVDACERVRDDAEAWVVVVTGAGERAFSSGVDLKEGGSGSPAVDPEGASPQARAVEAIAALDRPVIAAVRGYALGGGLEIALACDLRVAAADATFAFPEPTVGAMPSLGGTQRLPRTVGLGRAMELLLTGERIDAAEAHRLGLVSQVVAPAELEQVTRELAAKLAGVAPIAARYCKEAVRKGLDLTLDQGLRLEADLSVLLQTTEDRAEGIAAFLEKRDPSYRGR